MVFEFLFGEDGLQNFFLRRTVLNHIVALWFSVSHHSKLFGDDFVYFDESRYSLSQRVEIPFKAVQSC